jgi:hypothetical protein
MRPFPNPSLRNRRRTDGQGRSAVERFRVELFGVRETKRIRDEGHSPGGILLVALLCCYRFRTVEMLRAGVTATSSCLR